MSVIDGISTTNPSPLTDDAIAEGITIMDEQEKKPRGRPKGSKNKVLPQVVTHYEPPKCPRCKQADTSTVINTPRNRVISGKRHTWRNMQCECGQRWRQIAIETNQV